MNKMKKNPSLLIVTLALLMAVMVNAKPYQVTVAKLNVRNAPNTSGKVLGSLSQNATVEVNRVSGGWAEITFKGQKAYISAQYITPAKSSSTSKSTTSSKSSASTAKSSSTAKSKDTKSTKSSGKAKSYVEGFHISLGAYWTARNFIDGSGIREMGANGFNRYGLTIGPGLEYNGAVYRGKKANILLGFRSGLYYDWHGTATFPDEGTDADHTQFGRVSTHSFTIPLQPMLSIEWKSGKSDMAIGWFTGPVFELFLAHNGIDWGVWDGIEYVEVCDYISGKDWYLKGSVETIWLENPDRCGVFNCYWGSGLYFQVNRFRIQLASDWGIHRYAWSKGGVYEDGQEVEGERLIINRFINLGFSVTLY